MHHTNGAEDMGANEAEDGYPVAHPVVAFVEHIPGRCRYLIRITAGCIALRAVHPSASVIVCSALGRKSTLHTPP